MTVINKSSIVPYTPDEMYCLVNDIKSYPDFLPWCKSSQVSQESENRLTASVNIAVGKIRHSFSTENKMEPGREIEMQLVEGPFKHLTGIWNFSPIDNDKCSVSLYMNFEFKNKLLKIALEGVFNRIIASMIDAFIDRAKEVYG